MNRSYLISGIDYGTFSLPANWLAEHSVFWYCIRCRTIYATLEVKGGEAWDARAGCCPRCQPFPSAFWQVPGSIWEDFDRQRNWALPDPIVEREFWLHINFWEKQDVNSRCECASDGAGGDRQNSQHRNIG